jgi:hypothetical protein
VADACMFLRSSVLAEVGPRFDPRLPHEAREARSEALSPSCGSKKHRGNMSLKSVHGMAALALLLACGDDAGSGAGGAPSSGGGGNGSGAAPIGGGDNGGAGDGGAAVDCASGDGGCAGGGQGGGGTGGGGTGGASSDCITCSTALLDPTATQGASFCDGSGALHDAWVACVCTPGSSTCGDGNECDADASCPPAWPPSTAPCGNCVAQKCEPVYDACVADM